MARRGQPEDNKAKGKHVNSRQPLYGKAEADALRQREVARAREDRQKFALLLENLLPCRRLVDIGCGQGQLLAMAAEQVEEIWGVEESPQRAEDVKRAAPKAKVVVCNADRLDLPDAYFDVAVTSQTLHEVKVFGGPDELTRALREIRRVLTAGGRHLLVDHQDAGDGKVTVSLPREQIERLVRFERKFRYYRAGHERLGGGLVRISKRCLQDFLTKTWSLGSAMESVEMDETHNVFERQALTRLLEAAGLRPERWTNFADIREDLVRAGGRLLSGTGWFRKFLLVSRKAATDLPRT